MELQPLSVKTRANSGKGTARRLRAAGKIPGVLYGQGSGAVHIELDEPEFNHLVHSRGGEHSFIDLKIEDNPELSCRAMIKDVQHDPIRGDFLHVDLFRIDMSKKITTVVPVELTGHCVGVVNGGVLDHQTREIEVECLPGDVPESFVLDISNLDIGDNIIARDVKAPEGVEILESEDRAIVTVHAPRVIKEEGAEAEELAAAEEAAAGEAAAGAEED